MANETCSAPDVRIRVVEEVYPSMRIVAHYAYCHTCGFTGPERAPGSRREEMDRAAHERGERP